MEQNRHQAEGRPAFLLIPVDHDPIRLHGLLSIRRRSGSGRDGLGDRPGESRVTHGPIDELPEGREHPVLIVGGGTRPR